MAYPVTLNGRTYTLADFAGTNYVDGFPDALEDFVTQAGNIYTTTSASSVAIGTGSKTFTVADSGKPYIVGTPLRIADTAAPSTNWIDGIVTAYSGTTLTVNAIAYAGSGTKTAWSINIGGSAVAYTGTLPIAQGGTGATTAGAAATNLGLGTGDTPTFAGLNVNGTPTFDGLTVDGNLSLVNGAWTVSASAADNSVNLDASGNLLVGKTSTSFGAAGIALLANGGVTATKSADAPLGLNRLTSDGNILTFSRDGTTVGSIGSHSGFVTMGNGDTSLVFDAGSNTIEPFNQNDRTAEDAAITLGWSSNRFKDLYLSGGVYLGGTGAANLLDDYEEGTWTPVIRFGGNSVGVTYSTREGKYTKIGRLVTYYFEVSLSARGTSVGNLDFVGFPFSPVNTATPPSILTGQLSSTNDVQGYLNSGGLLLENRNTGTQSPLTHNNVNSNSTFYICGIYETS